MEYIYTTEYYSSIKNNEFMKFLEATPHPRASRDKTTNQRVHMEGLMAPAACVAKDGFI